METKRSKSKRLLLAEKAIELMKEGILEGNSVKINSAFQIVQHKRFNWIGLHRLQYDWEELTNEAMIIIKQ